MHLLDVSRGFHVTEENYYWQTACGALIPAILQNHEDSGTDDIARVTCLKCIVAHTRRMVR